VNVSGKCSGVFVDGCKKTDVFTDTTMAGVEVVNSQRINLYINTSSPSVAIDKTDGIVVHLKETSLETVVTSSKSSEMNISWIDAASDELVERPIPEQYVHRLNLKTKKVTAEVSDLYS
jgi:hypothetical protein